MKYFIIGLIVLVVLVVWFKQPPKRTGLENGTRITLTSQSMVLHATLNDTVAAKSLEAKLPMQISFGRSSVDYCATAPQLDSSKSQSQFGWHNGDISYVGGWLSIFYSGQHRLPMPMMVLGSIDSADMAKIKEAGSQVSFTIEVEK